MSRVADVLASLKVSIGIAATSIGSGVSLILGIIPDNIGKLATFAGVLLSCYMIVYWRKNAAKIDQDLAKGEIELEIKQIEREKMQIELEHARREAEHRRRAEDK